MENYLKLCYSPIMAGSHHNRTHHQVLQNASFTVWYNGDFGLCFEYLTFSAFLGAMFCILSALYAGCKNSKIQRRGKPLALIIRGMVSASIMMTFLVDFVGTYWLSPGRPYSVMVSLAVQILAWASHVYCIWVLSCSSTHYGRGPLNLNAAWLLVFVGNFVQLRTTIKWMQNQRPYQRSSLPIEEAYFSNLTEIVVYVVFSLQCLYGLSLLIKVDQVTGNNVSLQPTLYQGIYQRKSEWTDDADMSVNQHLISSEWTTEHVPSSYGAFPRHNSTLRSGVGHGNLGNFGEIEASEDDANVLSCLSFWWVEPLMRRGALGFLRKPEDLLQLPKSLNTMKIREKFQTRKKSMQGDDSRDDVLDVTSDEVTNGTFSTGDGEVAANGCINSVAVKFDERGGGSICSKTDSEGSSNLNMKDTTLDAFKQIESQKREAHTAEVAGDCVEGSLFWSLNKVFGLHYYPLGILKFAADMLGFVGPLLLHALVSFMENETEPISHGYYYALGLFLSTLLGSLLTTHFSYQVNKFGLKVRAALITEVYRKALSVSSVTLSKFSTGEVVNFMSTDTDRIVNFGASFHQFWSLPFQIVVSLALLYQQVGLASLAGLGFCILLVPVNRWLAVKIGKLSTAMMAQKDQRIKVMGEILAGIRVIKLNTWENIFINRIEGYRAAELKSLKGRKYLDALCVYFWATTPVLISILTFTTYVAMGHTLTAAKVFTSVALFNILISPLNAFPWVINGLMEAWVSIKRVNSFLQLKELDPKAYYGREIQSRASEKEELDQELDLKEQSGPFREHHGASCAGYQRNLEFAVSIRNGCFTWTREKGRSKVEADGARETASGADVSTRASGGEGASRVEWRLRDISLVIKPGQFVGVVGRIGSGKTSLLSAITAEMCKVHGEVDVMHLSEGLGLFAQEAWIQHATVKENIVFGQAFSAAKYNAIISATALEEDMKILAAGDETEVGENGVTLSGGQKARIALARAIYQDKSIYLLDDPLAAVDAHVASHIYLQCILGLLKGKTRIVCSHNVRFLQEADLVIYMVDGRIHSSGRPDEILPLVESESMQVITELGTENLGDDDLASSAITKANDDPAVSCGGDVEQVGGAVLVKEEEKEVGVVSFSVYFSYWSAVGHILGLAIILALLLMQVSRNINDWWLAYWITHSANITDSSQSDDLKFYLGIYGGLAAANSVFTLFRAFLYAYGGVCAAAVLHRKLLHAVLSTSVSFFDTTPIGRILNRFSSDVYAIDDSLPFIMNILLSQVYGLLGTLAITCYGLPWFTVLLLPLSLFYYHIQHFYRKTSRELKRLSTITLSPIYAHFSETLTGLCTIRALRATDRFNQDNVAKVDVNQRANYGSFAVAQWLGIRLQMLGVLMVAGVAFIAVLEHHFNTVNPGLVGLAISYALSVTNLLSGMVTSFTETEKEMVSVERAMQYITGTPTEKRDGNIHPPRNWPSRGVVEFKEAVLTYRKSLPSALKEVSFRIRPGEKVGVVGRTGAGKSSLFKAIFRLVDLSSGSIHIDGVDIADISLERLRSNLAIIPQDIFLFSGSLRGNLDPCNKHDDNELWSALESCHLKEAVIKLGGLECEVEEKGRVFSAGQCQLVCLARALITRACIICIDEATSSVDQQTDSEIQLTLRSKFPTSTVITIAHRIETVLNSDRILVMEQGSVQEFASPGELLGNHDSLFYSLYKEYYAKSNSES